MSRHSLPEHPLVSTEGPGYLGWAQPETPAGWSCLDHRTAEPTVSAAPLFRAPGGGTSRHWPLLPGSQGDPGLGPSQQVAETEAWLFSHVTKWKKSWLVPGRTGMDKPFG